MIATKCFVFRFSDVEVHENELRATRAGQPLDIEPKAFRVLVYLVKHAGHLVSKSELMDAVWGETAVTENSLTRAIALLRRVLEDDPHQPHFIETVSTAGYRFICPVVNEESPGSTRVADLVSSSVTTTEPVVTMTRPRGWLSQRWPWVAVAGLAATIVFALVWMAWFSAPPTLIVTSIEPLTHDGLNKLFPRSDGTRIYFAEIVQGRSLLSQVSTVGGEISRISNPFANPVIRDVAPDGSKLLVIELEGNPASLWLLPLPAGTPRRLGSLEGYDASWSPDGKRLLFAKSSEIWTADGDGANPRRILTTSGAPWHMRFSPDGARIRYTLVISGVDGELWEARTDGSGAQVMLPGWHTDMSRAGGVWSPDGRFYAFIEGSVTDDWNIWVSPETRSFWPHRKATPMQLTHGPLTFWAPLTFSPDGRTLFADGVLRRGELVRYDPGTGRVTPYLSGISAGGLAFSRDGQWIAYISYSDATLWRCRIDGGDRQQLTTSGRATLPQWSPDGRSIAFVKGESGKPDKIAIIPMDGGNAEDLSKQEEGAESDANWSPDGTKIIFGVYVNAGQWGEIREEDLRTRKVTSLPGSKGLYSPRWSPDGRYLVALSMDNQRLMQFDFEKQVWSTWITAPDLNTGDLAYPVWSSDSRFLYFGNVFSHGITDVEEWRTRSGQRVAENRGSSGRAALRRAL